MSQLILLSIVLGPILIAVRCARAPLAVRGFKRMLLLGVLFNVAYALAVLLVYPRL